MRRSDRTAHAGVAALMPLLAVSLFVVVVGAVRQAVELADLQVDAATAFVCPMHPEHTAGNEGSCPICGMALVPAAPFDVRDYRMDFRTVPPGVTPGEKAMLRFGIFHPGTGQRVTRFETVHEQRYHLFVISQDLEYFRHIHPEQQRDGTWSVDVVLPKAGYYKVLSDFFPGLGSAQFIARPLVTAGYDGDLVASSARLVPDTAPTKVVDDVTATVSYSPSTFVAGQWGHLTFHLTDTASGRPITDLQSYLGAMGHTLIMSEDMVHYVHSHPINLLPGSGDDGPPEFLIPPGTDLETLRGGPDVTFEGLIPTPGRYRAWAQFRRHDRVYTFPFTFEATGAE